MSKITGTSHIEFEDESLRVDWELHPGYPQMLNVPPESDWIEVKGVEIDAPDGYLPCPDDLYNRFVEDEAALAHLMEVAKEEILVSKEEAMSYEAEPATVDFEP